MRAAINKLWKIKPEKNKQLNLLRILKTRYNVLKQVSDSEPKGGMSDRVSACSLGGREGERVIYVGGRRVQRGSST